MKKLLSLIVVLTTVGTLFSQEQRKWQGIQEEKVWDYATPNWLDASPLPIPKTFVEGADALFDDSSVEGAETVTVKGEIVVNGVLVNATKNYTIKMSETTDNISGAGALVKKGTGTLNLNVENKLTGGTVIEEGIVRMDKQDSPNVFGEKIVFAGGTADFATSSSGNYPSISVPIEIAEGKSGKVLMSRYSYFSSPISGSGDFEIATGGERAMLGHNSKSGVEFKVWDDFTGNLIISKNELAGVSPGYYGLLIPGNKTYDYEDLTTADSLLVNKTVILKSGVGLTSASGTKAYLIGELQAEDETSFLAGYGAGNSLTPRVTWIIGASNTSVTSPVTIRDSGSSGYNYVGIVKIGTGTYTFTSTKSITTASTGVVVKEGKFYVNTPIEEGITSLGRVSGNVLTVEHDAVGGGTGRLTGDVVVDSLGTLEVGLGYQTGELSLSDIDGGSEKAGELKAKEHSILSFKLATADNYDKITAVKSVQITGTTIKLRPAGTYNIKDGDTFDIIVAAQPSGTTPTFTIDFSEFDEGISFTGAVVQEEGQGTKIVITAAGNAAGLQTLQAQEQQIVAYPNPSVDGLINLKSNSNQAIDAVEIFNIQGQVVWTQTTNSFTAKLDLSSLVSGIYYARTYSGGQTQIQKIILK